MFRAGARLEPTRIGSREFRWGERTYVMGVLNVTPDSFSGDGLIGDVERAVARALALQEQGADIVDVGGESTRPPGPVYGRGAADVSAEEEMARVVPVIERLRAVLDVPISVDTYKAEVARAAVAAGASLINDVWGLQCDPPLAPTAAELGVPLVVMHNQHGTDYADLVGEVTASLDRSVDRAVDAGMPRGSVIVDPGFGFGKTPAHNLEVLRRLHDIRESLGRPVLIGTSRKSTIGLMLGGLPPDERLEGTAATIALAIAHWADIVRVHDVRAMARVARMSDAVVRGWAPPVP